MRTRLLILLVLACALLSSACAGGPEDADTRLAEACERQIDEVAEEETGTPTAKSTEERLEEETLIECAGQEVTVVASGEEGEAAEKGTSEQGDQRETEDPGSGGDEAAPAKLEPEARSLFAETCGSCHTLSDAETTGDFGPNLDETTLDSTGVLQKIEEGGGGMPPNLLEGDDAEQVAEYVAGAASQARSGEAGGG